MDTLAGEKAQGITIREEKTSDGKTWGYTFIESDGSAIELSHLNGNEVYVNSQYAGDSSTEIYQAIYALAHNNGWKVVEDEAGLSEIAKLRRTSQMFSSALRFGTTRHLEPGPQSGIEGWRYDDSPEATDHNIGLLALREAELTGERLPFSRDMSYDSDNQAFYDGGYRIPGEEVKAYLEGRIEKVDSEFSHGVGHATLRRTLATLSAKEAEPGGRLVGMHAETDPALRAIRYAKSGGASTPGRGEEAAAGGESARVSGEAGRGESGRGLSSVEHAAQVRGWTGEIRAGWGSQLDVVVHDSAEEIANARLREAVLKEGVGVEAFFDPRDGRIHLLADRVGSKADAERLMRHEGIHWALRGPMKLEYAKVLEQIGRDIRWEDLQETIAKYPNGTPDLWIEEHLASIGETNPQSPLWRRALAAIRQMLRDRFGAKLEFTEDDIRAFLRRANRRFERARENDSSLFTPSEGDDPLYAKVKKKQGQDRKSWSEVRKGDNWNSVKKYFGQAKEDVEAPTFSTLGDKDSIVLRAEEFLRENPVVTDWTGRTVYLPYGQTEGSYGPHRKVRNRAEHIVCRDIKQGTHQRFLDVEKAKWLAAVPQTIREGAVRVSRESSVYYYKNYRGVVHMVITSREGVMIDQTVLNEKTGRREVRTKKLDSGLVTQFSPKFDEIALDEARVDSVRGK